MECWVSLLLSFSAYPFSNTIINPKSPNFSIIFSHQIVYQTNLNISNTATSSNFLLAAFTKKKPNITIIPYLFTP